jgi:hypothetical protein
MLLDLTKHREKNILAVRARAICERAGVRLTERWTGNSIEYDVVDVANTAIFRNVHLAQFVNVNEPVERMGIPTR